MTLSSIGDLASSFQLRRDTVRVRADLNRYTDELSSGVTQDLVGRLKGNFRPLAGLERELARLDSFRTVIAEHRLVTATMQSTLGHLRGLGEISGALLTVPESADPTFVINAGNDAHSRFASAVSSLNVQAGGRTLFAGVAVDRPALADAESILTALEADITLAGATTATAIEAVVVAWFAPGGGYDASGYLGDAAMTVGPRLSDGETAAPPVTAQASPIRDYLAALSLGALLGRGILSGNTTEQGALARTAGERLIVADGALIAMQSSVGTTENQIQRSSVEVDIQHGRLEITRTELIEADPYETAIRLQVAESQLQTIYTITARLSRLSLAEYL